MLIYLNTSYFIAWKWVKCPGTWKKHQIGQRKSVNPHWSRVPLTSLVRVSWHPTIRYIIYSTHYYEDWVILIIRVHVYLFRLCIQQHFFLSFYRSKQAKDWALRTASDGYSDWDRFIQLLKLTWFKRTESIFNNNTLSNFIWRTPYNAIFFRVKFAECNKCFSFLLAMFFVLFGIVLTSGDVESNYQSAKWKGGGGIDWCSVVELQLKTNYN